MTGMKVTWILVRSTGYVWKGHARAQGLASEYTAGTMDKGGIVKKRHHSETSRNRRDTTEQTQIYMLLTYHLTIKSWSMCGSAFIASCHPITVGSIFSHRSVGLLLSTWNSTKSLPAFDPIVLFHMYVEGSTYGLSG